MISTIIFSEGSPLRLDALLQSINKNANSVFSDTAIIYKSDFKESDEAYNIVQAGSNYKKSKHLKEDVISAIEAATGQFICFMSEGDLIFRDITQDAKEIEKVFDDPMVLSFSMRLGTNTTKCYFTRIDNRLYGQEVDGNVMKFDWQKHYMDYSNPFCMNGQIFRTQEILKFVKKIQFNSSLELEDALYLFQDYPKNKMGSFVNGALVTIPTPEIRSMVKDSKSARPEDHKSISEKFIAGERIDFDAMDFTGIDACYVEKEYPIKNIIVNA
jgi:hypothetical protein